MQDLSLGSVSIWLRDLKAGDQQSAQHLWNRYFQRLVVLARSRLMNRTRVADEEDIALNALNSLFLAVQQGRYPNLSDRSELWPLLVSITLRKTTNQLKWNYAQKRTPRAEVAQDEMDHIAALDPGPEEVIQLSDQVQHLLQLLPDEKLARIARQRLAGDSVAEIAADLAVSRRTVARKLARIRQEWEEAVC